MTATWSWPGGEEATADHFAVSCEGRHLVLGVAEPIEVVVVDVAAVVVAVDRVVVERCPGGFALSGAVLHAPNTQAKPIITATARWRLVIRQPTLAHWAIRRNPACALVGPPASLSPKAPKCLTGLANWATRQPISPSAERTRAECCPGPEMRDRLRMIDPRSDRAQYPRHRVVLARIRALLD
jgi:hypothetical protein